MKGKQLAVLFAVCAVFAVLLTFTAFAEPQPSASETEQTDASTPADAQGVPVTFSDPGESADTTASEDQPESQEPANMSLPVDNTRAQYIIKYNSYDSAAKEYKMDVYLKSNEYISVGTFGVEYDAMLSPTFDLDTDNFTYFKQYNCDGKNYMVFSWYLYEYSSEYKNDTTGLHLGTITVGNIELDDNGLPENWHTRTFHQLDWYNTDFSSDPVYINISDNVCLNVEIYNQETDWYQGMSYGTDARPDTINPNFDNWYEWIDIGFVLGIDGLPERQTRTIEGKILSYNLNNPIKIELLDGASSPVVASSDINLNAFNQHNADDSYSSSYQIVLGSDVSPGTYTLIVSKDVHLTYTTEVTVTDNAETIAKNIELYCGDINGSVSDIGTPTGDERIKLNDRTALLSRMNKQIDLSTDPLAARADLNGDNKVTIHDLNILNRYYNKEYPKTNS